MRTIGVDLAAQPKKTGLCVVDWAADVAVAHVEVGVTDDRIEELAASAAKVGIDAPFGWPDPFVDAISRHQNHEQWTDADRDELILRTTDRQVWEITGRRPLSVSSDRISVTAMRCAALLGRLEGVGLEVDRAGISGSVVEVYPAAALTTWNLASRGYKASNGGPGRDVLLGLVADLARHLAPISWGDSSSQLVSENDDAFDALVCAVIAAAAFLGMTRVPTGSDKELAEREGWIHVPVVDLPTLRRSLI